MKTSDKALIGIIVIACGVILCIAGAWMGNLAVSLLGLMVFVAGFLYGYTVVNGLPDEPDDEEDAG